MAASPEPIPDDRQFSGSDRFLVVGFRLQRMGDAADHGDRVTDRDRIAETIHPPSGTLQDGSKRRSVAVTISVYPFAIGHSMMPANVASVALMEASSPPRCQGLFHAEA
ncbi:hypothetical protein ACVJMZ_000005 [Sinorhizobium medicae]